MVVLMTCAVMAAMLLGISSLPSCLVKLQSSPGMLKPCCVRQVYIVRTPDTCPNQQGPRALAAAGGPSASIAALAPASATLVTSAPGPANLTGLYYGPSAPGPNSSGTRN